MCKAGDFDLLTDGYVVATPSRTTGEYVYLSPLRPADKLPDAPAWSVAMLAGEAQRRASRPAPVATRAQIDEGGPPVRLSPAALEWWDGTRRIRDRSGHLYALAKELWRAGASVGTIVTALAERDVALFGSHAKYAGRPEYYIATAAKAVGAIEDETPPASPAAPRPADVDSCADVRDELAQVRAELAAVIAERDQWRDRAGRAEERAEQLGRERTLIIETINNPANRQRTAVAFAVQAIAESTISRGLDKDGWSPLHYGVIEKRTGVPRRTVQRQVKHLCDEGIFAKDVTRLGPGNVDPETGEILDRWTSSVVVQPQPSFAALCEVMRDTVLPDERKQGGARCSKHPDADVIVRTHERTMIITTTTCSVCGDEISVAQRLKRQDGISEDEPADSQKRQDDISAPNPYGGLRPTTRQDGISAPRETCRDCGRPLTNAIARALGSCTHYCGAYDEQHDIPQPQPLWSSDD
jgi:hypothetical protein